MEQNQKISPWILNTKIHTSSSQTSLFSSSEQRQLLAVIRVPMVISIYKPQFFFNKLPTKKPTKPFSCLYTMGTIIVFLFLFLSHSIAQDDTPIGYNGSERDALYALKAKFNHPLLDKNWTGLQCYMNSHPRWYGIQCYNGRVTGISLEGIGLIGKFNVYALVNLTELSTISFKNNRISGNVMDFTSNRKLTHVDLSNNMFDGPISSSLLGLDSLESLQLQGNNLKGPILQFSQASLRMFNVSNNNLSGKIPQTEVLQLFNFSSYFGNSGLCGLPSPITCDDTTNVSIKKTDTIKDKFFKKATLIAIFVLLVVVVLALVLLFFIRRYKKEFKIKKEMKEKERIEVQKKKMESGEGREVGVEARRKLTFMDGEGGIELNDLLKASAEGLGKGNFGNTYKAMLENGLHVVVKRLRDLKPLSGEEFAQQMRAIAELKHPNVLPLTAYYYSKDEKFLVYKFAQNGNLFNRIHGGRGKNRIPFNWNSRLLVAQGVARALNFLHVNTKSQTTIIHGNLKSSNVLLDANECPLVSDYGFASLIAVPIVAQRMISYKSPEYQHAKKISKKSDVWSYGSLLLELLTGRLSTYSAPQGVNGVDLYSWVHRAAREEWTAEIFDLEICKQRNAADEMLRLLQIALKCSDKSPEKRPDMEEVVREVEDIRIIDSEEDNDGSLEQSFADDSFSTNGSGIIGEER